MQFRTRDPRRSSTCLHLLIRSPPLTYRRLNVGGTIGSKSILAGAEVGGLGAGSAVDGTRMPGSGIRGSGSGEPGSGGVAASER